MSIRCHWAVAALISGIVVNSVKMPVAASGDYAQRVCRHRFLLFSLPRRMPERSSRSFAMFSPGLLARLLLAAQQSFSSRVTSAVHPV